MSLPTKEELRRTLEERVGPELQERFSSAAVAVCGLGRSLWRCQSSR